MRRAVERDPLNVNWRGVLVAHLVNAGRYEEALHEGQKALDITQTETHPFLGIGEAYLALGRSPKLPLLPRERIRTSRSTLCQLGCWQRAWCAWARNNRQRF